jgi:hypothetical protein
MHKIYSTLFFLSVSCFAAAQDSARQKLSGTFRQRYDFFTGRALTHSLGSGQEYASAEVNYKTVSGNYRARQDAARETGMSFFTEGTRKINKYSVSGSFGFTRTLKDSMGYTLRSSQHPAPYYFYSGAKGNWEISHYQLRGLISRQVGEKLSISAGGRYQAGNAWRSNDPRTEEFLHDMSGEIALLYRVHKRHTLGLGGGYGVANEENNNEYRKKDYQDNLLNMPYINVLQYGYGLSVIQTTNRRMDKKGERTSAGAVYRGAFGFGTIVSTVGFTRAHSRFFRNATDATSARYDYGSFDEDIWEANLLWEGAAKGPQRWSLAAAYKDHFGKDFNSVLNGNNYIYKEEKWQLQPIMAHWSDNCLQYELRINGSLSRMYRADGTTDHLTNYKNASMGLGGSYYFSGKKEARFLKLSAGVQWKQNLEKTVSVPKSQESLFTKEVVYYDYYYNGADHMSFSGEALYNVPVKKLPLFIRAAVEHQKASMPAATVAAEALPGTSRWFSSIALGFTL